MKRIIEAVLWPKARLAYPSIHGVLLGLVLVHVSLGLTSAFGPHTALWFYYGGHPGLVSLGCVHFVIAGMLLVGYYSNFALARFGLLFSITVYLLKFCLFTAGIVRLLGAGDLGTSSFEEPVFSLGLALLSAAAYRTPPVRDAS